MTTQTPASTPLTDREISWLETTLASPPFVKQAMGLDEIQGYLAAIICGPEKIPAGNWLPAVLGNPKYESELQEQELKDLLLRFHAEITADLSAERPKIGVAMDCPSIVSA